MTLFFQKHQILNLIFCLFILQFTNLNSQNNTITKETKQDSKDSIINQITLLRDEAGKLFGVDDVFKAIEKLEDGLKLYENNNIKDNTLLFGLYVDLSNAYSVESVRNEEKTLEYIDNAKSLTENTDVKTYDMINFYISLGTNEFEESKFKEALGYINKAHEILEKRNKKLIEEIGSNSEKKLKATLLEWFVTINFSNEKEGELLKSHKKLERFFLDNENNEDVIYYYALGSFRVGRFYQTRNATKAEFYFNKAEEKGDKNIRLYALICKGFAFLTAKDYNKIPNVINKLEAFENLNRFQELNLHEIAARHYTETQNIDRLIKHTNQALTLLNSNDIPIDVLAFDSAGFSPITQLKYPILLNQFALFLEQSNDPRLVATSTEIFKICLKQFDERIDRKPMNNHFVNYDIMRHRNLKWLIDTNASLNAKHNVLSQIERIDNRASLNRILFNRTLAENKSDLDSLLTQESEIREEITTLKQKQIEADTTMNQKLFELELQLKELNEKLVVENPTIFGLNTTKFNLSSIELDSKTKIIKYLKTEDKLFRVTISDSTISISDLGLYKSIENKVTAFLKNIKNYEDSDSYKKYSNDLYEQLLGDQNLLKHTIIITDACLRYLPFELLSKNDKFLIEKTAISYAQGLSYLNPKLYSQKTYEENITLFAPSYKTFKPKDIQLAVRGEPYDLKGATEEVQIINDIIKGVVFDNENASKTQFFSMSDNSAILHLAGHAFLNDNDPELSSIIFSDSEEDNELYISELYGFKSNADLAVLSACNTGVGGYNNGDGLVSLSQAFMYSGIPATVSSLWSAPDQSTKDIMISFYQYLKKGLPKSKALQQAKIDYLEITTNPKLKHPYYWAGFVLYGNDEPINFKNTSVSHYYWILGILMAILIFYIVKRKNSVSNK